MPDRIGGMEEREVSNQSFMESVGGFKETPIGKIPGDWEVVRLGDKRIAEIRGNKSVSGMDKVAFIPMELIPDSGVYAEYEIRKINEVRSSTYCEAGDLLLAKITPSLENGKQGIVPDDIPNGFALATTEVFPIICKGIDRLFLFYILKHPKFRKVLEYSMRGTTGRQRVPKEAVENLLIPFPPLPEQRKIAEILSTVDKAIERVNEAIAKTERLKKGLMQELLTKGINLFALEQQKIIDAVKRAYENKDHEFGREENLVSHLAGYLREKFDDYDIDSEVRKDLRGHRPDIIIHKRHTNVNLFAIEVKKRDDVNLIREDIKKLENLMLAKYEYCEAIFIGFNIENPENVLNLSDKVNFVLVTPEGKIITKVRRRKFKITEISRIPKEWEVVRLGDIANVKEGIYGKRSNRGTIIQLKADTITDDGKIDFTKYALVEINRDISEYLLKPGDIILSNRNSLDKVGKCAIFQGEINRCVYSNLLTRIRIVSTGVAPEWVLYTLMKMYNEGFFKSLVTRAVNQVLLKKTIVEKLKIPLPPLPEQQKIAEILSTVDKKLELERKRKEKLERIKKGLMSDLLTGRRRVKCR